MLIYCVEDDPAIRELVVYTLESAGYTAAGFETAQSFYAALKQQVPALVLLDIMLPTEDGLSVLRTLRANPATQQLPVILATAKGTEYDTVKGLDSGADDYLAKPFGMMELIARVKALLRRSGAKDTLLRAGSIALDTQRHKVYVNEEETVLTRKEFDLLQLLLQSPERIFTRDTVLSEVWGYEFDGETRTVDVHLRTLRQKLGSAGAQLETVRGVGYRLNLLAKENADET